MSKFRIVFICGSAEPGRDGVGDYTLRLAAQLMSNGHDAKIVALRDKFIENTRLEELSTLGQNVEVLRLSSLKSSGDRMKEATSFVRGYDPNWISLQFVAYGFSGQGVPLGLGRGISKMSPKAKTHVMIHEPYLTGRLSAKNSLVRIGQIRTLKSMISAMSPKAIHTSIPAYQDLLGEIGIEAELLGLFGNLPIAKMAKAPEKSEDLRAVFFGIGPLEKYFDSFLNEVQSFLQSTDKKLEWVFCGNPGQLGQRFIDYIKDAGVKGLTVTELGMMESGDLSVLFQTADFGISRVPPDLLGKSGTVVSILEHGLPLWVPLAKSTQQISEQFDFNTNRCFARLNELVSANGKEAPELRLPEIAEKLEKSLSSS